MESASQVNVPLRSGGKKMRKRRELDALVAHSLAKRANKKNTAGNGVNSQDQLLSPSTDEQEDFGWPKVVRNSNRHGNRKFSFIRMCAPLIFVTCISLSLGFMYWLYFDLRQQLYEYRQKIEEVSVTSQNLPEALQKWHETSKALEQNQTMIYGKISEIQRNLKTLTEDFTKYKEELKDKKDYSNDGKFVANFGAKIEAVSLDVEGMKEKFSEFQKNQNSIKTDVLRLKDNFTEVINQAAMLVNNKTTNYSKDINDLQELTFKEIKSVAMNLSTINDTLSQKQKILELELTTNKRRLDDLIEGSANTTSHVVSIQNDWTKYKDKISHLEESNAKIDEEIIAIRNLTAYLNNTVLDIQSKPDRIFTKLINPSKNDEKDVNKPFENNEQIFKIQQDEDASFLNKSKPNTIQQDIKQNNTSTEPPGIEKPKVLSI